MKKKTIENITKVLPFALKNATGYFKDNFDKSGQDLLGNATGTVGILVRFFAQDTIDSYFEKLTDTKLENFASNIYLQASLLQVGKSMESLNEEAIQVENVSSIVNLLIDTLGEISFNASTVLTIFTPQYHPIVIFVKEQMEKMLTTLKLDSEIIKSFTHNFNENIEATIKEVFGEEDYEKHLEEISKYIFDKREAKLLLDTYELHKIGFKDNESLSYEETFSSWQKTSELLDKEEELNDEEHKEFEKTLKPIEKLVEEYFTDCLSSNNCLDNILFTVADFGKGKSVFLQQYASKLARTYSETKEGYFPIYFNLREFQTYAKSQGKLGVIDGFLRKKYGISIEDETFKNRKYIFLIDSLDESGELNKENVENVINSIQQIQKLDDLRFRTNRIIITSRPFSSLLIQHIDNNKPHTIKEKDIEITQYISLYGFKKSQFNHWLRNTLKNYIEKTEVHTTGFAQEIIENIQNDNNIDVYEKLLDAGTLSRSELRRPIFAYMIYQLIINQVDFLSIGKIGVYLSFINLLTKKAKHIEDKDVVINQEEERRYRNILHSISALWMYKRQQGEQGILHKADICRVLEKKKNSEESDEQILERFQKEKKDVTEIEFLSNSYFGEKNNNLHFQHQSFAEILLAEYYLKVFIVYALDDERDLIEARSKLVLGEPTEQTIEFFKELLLLLKETVSDECGNVIEKRKLLYPLFASIATSKNNTLHSKEIKLGWFREKIEENSPIINKSLLQNWVIKEDEIDKIMELSKDIIDDKSTLLLSKTQAKTALFDNELTLFQNKKVSDSPADIDKWLALVVGNLLHTDEPENRKFFNGNLENPENLFDMIRGWNYFTETSSPSWSINFFKGIQLKKHIDIKYISKLIELDFSYSRLTNLTLAGTTIWNSDFNNCIFDHVNFYRATIMYSKFNNINIIGDCNFTNSLIDNQTLFPIQLAKYFDSRRRFRSEYKNIQTLILSDNHEHIFKRLSGFLIYGLKNDLFDIGEIKSWFLYDNDKTKKKFEKLIYNLKV